MVTVKRHSNPLDLWVLSVTQNAAVEAEATADLEVNVIFTDDDGILEALKTAGILAHNLRARVNVLAFQVVPLAFPLTRPPVSIPFTERRLLELASRGVQGPLNTTVQIYLCRDMRQGLLQALRPNSLVVIRQKKRWWRTRDQRLSKQLRQDGHQVISAYVQ
jgi:hypothetical protein